MFAATAQGLGQNLARLPQAPEVLAARLTLLVENASAGCSGEAALALARQILAEGAHADQLEVNLAGSMAALFLDDWSLARQFWRRHEAATGQKPAPQPESPAKLCLQWAKVLTAAERFGSAGFPFDPATRLPRAAVECLYLAQRLDPEDIETTRRLAAQTASLRGHDFTRLGQLSTLALHRPGDWRTGLQLGMAGLKTYRREAGLEEIVLALGQARAQGKVEGFLGTLAALDPGGGVLAELRKRGVA